MTVEQLIEELKKMPKDAEVGYYDGDNGLTQIAEAEFIKNPFYNHLRRIKGDWVILGE